MGNEQQTLFKSFIRICNLYANRERHEFSTVGRYEFRELFPKKNMGTIDYYRKMLCDAGYMETDGYGIYEMLRPIPLTMTVTQLRREVYCKKSQSKNI